MESKEVFIVSAVRTPIGSFGGSLKDIPATKLGAIVIKAAVEKAGINPAAVKEVYMGCVLQANLGQAPARQAAIFAGLPENVCCTTINKVCASGMKAIMNAAQSILLGDADVVVAGGMENMSSVPFYATANAAELCAKECNISREQQDEFAIESYRRSQEAIKKEKFKEEIAGVEIPQRKGAPIVMLNDEEPFNVKFDKVPELKSPFEKGGSVTAANASTINDGAAALVLMSKAKADELGVKPIAKIIGYADAEQAPEWFTTTPSLALPKALLKAGIRLEQVDYFELNEAFSVVGIVNTQKMNLDPGKVNVNGGAVSLGHPLGCSGARIIVTLINVLRQNKGKIGAAGICNGGGGASAMVLELC